MSAVLVGGLVLLPVQSKAEDNRQFVQFPPEMQAFMLTNMQDHMAALNEVMVAMSQGDLKSAANIAEQRLGISSMGTHGGGQMGLGRMMPIDMRQTGMAMHKSASRFSLLAEQGDAAEAYKALAEVTTACYSCHSRFRIR